MLLCPLLGVLSHGFVSLVDVVVGFFQQEVHALVQGVDEWNVRSERRLMFFFEFEDFDEVGVGASVGDFVGSLQGSVVDECDGESWW